MIMKVFSIFDTKTQTYSNPFYALTAGAAIRTFGDAAKDIQSIISQHPADFLLYDIGEWDDHTGEITTHPPHALGSASDYNPITPADQEDPERKSA